MAPAAAAQSIGRFQRGKYLNQVASVRRELAAWEATYRTMQVDNEALKYTPRQLAIAIARQLWIDELIGELELVEEMLSRAPSVDVASP